MSEREPEFSLERFIQYMTVAESLMEDQVQSHVRTNTVMRMVLDNDVATHELLDSCTLEELEWVFDSLLYWPSCEQSLEEGDMNHFGVQQAQARELISGLSQKPSIKKKVTFI